MMMYIARVIIETIVSFCKIRTMGVSVWPFGECEIEIYNVVA